jgi:hypothetical protein
VTGPFLANKTGESLLARAERAEAKAADAEQRLVVSQAHADVLKEILDRQQSRLEEATARAAILEQECAGKDVLIRILQDKIAPPGTSQKSEASKTDAELLRIRQQSVAPFDRPVGEWFGWIPEKVE